MNRLTTLLVSGCTALGFALAAHAGDAPSHSSASRIVVDYSDLDLDREEGTQTLYARLKSAASQVCGRQPPLIELERHARYEACVDKTLDDAVGQVRSRSLQALHARSKDDATVS